MNKPDILCLITAHGAFLIGLIVAIAKDAVWQRPGEMKRGALSWGRFYLVHGLLLLLLFQLISTTEVAGSWNWRPLVSILDFVGVTYLALLNGWFRNWLVGLFSRLEARPE